MTTSDELDSAIAALWARQRDEMLNRVELVEHAVVALLEGELREDQRAEAERAAHKIAGAAGSFGFAAASEQARAIELQLRSGVSLEDGQRLAELVLEIRGDFDRDPQRGEDASAAGGPPTVDVLIVGDEVLAARDLQADLTARGLRVGVAKDEGDVELRLNAATKVVDLSAPLAESFMNKLGDERHALVIGITADAALGARVDFARRGGHVLLSPDLTAREIADAVVAMREQQREKTAHVLLVDDDVAVLDLMATLLPAHGFEVTTLDDPSRFWQTLEAQNPDALVLDLEMPGFNGTELCRAVRADLRWSQLPVLFMTTRGDPESVRAVFAAGADDYMTKPVGEQELVQRIRNRLARVQALRDLADRDPLTGLANRRKASEQLARLERLSKRYGQPLTLAIVDLDHFKDVNDSFGHDIGDEVLRRLARRLELEFRGEDVVARWGGEEFLIGMYGMPGAMAVERLQRLLDDWQRERFKDRLGGFFGSTFTVGLAELPGAAESLDELQRAADEALYRAKAAGRSRIQAAGGRDEAEIAQVDIVVVEDDSALVALLTHSLSTQGWSVRALEDGPTAVGALASEPPLLEARLVLLDWDLPGLDGLAVLKRLRERGLLSHTRVVMLTARAGESEILKALELGAVDHVAKPFSVPVLLQKVRQLLAPR
jgi:diguanylate cyclase (GGDEF)-like protein